VPRKNCIEGFLHFRTVDSESIDFMKSASKNWALLVLGLGIAAAAYIWLDATPTAQVNSSTSPASATVPAPGPGQKKVVLKNLGMT